MNKTLLIMAAGLASRYGGNKQTEKFGPNGEMLMEYSIRSAAENGFNKVVFVVGDNKLDSFMQIIDSRKIGIKTEFAVQSYKDLPEWFKLPEGRDKPYGTVHAVLSAREYINEPFAVINADDYYGKLAFGDLSNAIDDLSEKGEGCMLAYPLINTLSGFGTVTRGVCLIENNRLVGINETYSIKKCEDGIIRSFDSDANGTILAPDSLVSMNIFGFMPWIFKDIEKYFYNFLKGIEGNELKKEYPIPIMLDSMINEGVIRIKTIPTQSKWLGVTYKEDKELVVKALREEDL